MRKGRLLAKSYKGGGEPPNFALLTSHIRDVADAGEALLDTVGTRSLDNANLKAPEWWERLNRSSRLGFWLHDIGKSNEHFHLILEGNRDFTQILRHEIISAILATREPIQQWIRDSGYDDRLIYPALWAIAGHHRKFGKDTKPGTAPPAEIYTNHRDYHSILAEMTAQIASEVERDKVALIGPAAPLKIGCNKSCEIVAAEVLSDLKEDWKGRAAEFYEEEGFDRLIAIQKALTIAADVCASAFARTADAAQGMTVSQFVTESLSAGLSPTDLDKLMWNYAWARADENLGHPEDPDSFPPGFEFREFQRNVAQADSPDPPSSLLTLAVAGCGSGKSLAAYLWARRWCQAWADEGRTNFRLMFTLPTTGTATEHFKEYALACGVSPKLKGLSHSRSSVDLTFVAQETAPQEESRIQSDKSKQAEQMLQAQTDKLESLDLWGTPLVVGTADTVLGLMANARRPIYSFPAIMQSAIVFDEVHAYDEEMFGHLLVFLQTFPKIPILLMTASLPSERREAIEKVRGDLRIVEGPKEHESRRRYDVPIIKDNDDDIWESICDCLKDPSRGKVLWVRNQVDWAVRSYQKCHRYLADLAPFIGLYHSRFRYKDRAKVHADVIARFNKKGAPCILVATQVAEISLDLSADLLISDLAIIPALIQRLGRLNRFAETDKGPSGASIFCRPPFCEGKRTPNPLPYTEKDLKQAESWIGKLREKGGRLSQSDLAETFSGFEVGSSADIALAQSRAVFVSGLWETYPASTRGDGYTMPVVLQKDYENYPKDRLNDFKFRREWLREHEVSIPIRDEMLRWRDRLGRTPIAPSNAVKYGYIDAENPTERTGASWADHRSIIV